jgi:hypothetical protein
MADTIAQGGNTQVSSPRISQKNLAQREQIAIQPQGLD